MVSSIFDGWGLPSVVSLWGGLGGGGASGRLTRVVGLPRCGVLCGRRLGGVYLARPAPSALMQTRPLGLDFRACPGVGRRGRGVRRGVGAVCGARLKNPCTQSASAALFLAAKSRHSSTRAALTRSKGSLHCHFVLWTAKRRSAPSKDSKDTESPKAAFEITRTRSAARG